MKTLVYEKENLEEQPEKLEEKSRPRLKWQTGAYARFAVYKFALPYPFLLLCKLMNITPDQLQAKIKMMDLHRHGGKAVCPARVRPNLETS